MQRILTLLTALPTPVAVLIILSATILLIILLLWSVSYYNRLQLQHLRKLDIQNSSMDNLNSTKGWPHTTPDWMTEPTPHVTNSASAKYPARHNSEDLQ